LIKELVASYRGTPTLCLVGDSLPREQWLWKQYALLAKYANPIGPIPDNDANLTDNLAFVVHEMFWDVNAQLEKYALELQIVGGNLYLVRK
jgi:hypothetical protein